MGILEGLARDLPSSVVDVRHFIDCVERAALELDEKLELDITHHFSHNVYAREMKLPATALVVGRIHRFNNLNILSEGEASVFSIDGPKRVKAPYTYVAKAGSKRLIYAHTDVTWTTIIGTSLREAEEIQDHFTSLSYDDLKEAF